MVPSRKQSKSLRFATDMLRTRLQSTRRSGSSSRDTKNTKTQVLGGVFHSRTEQQEQGSSTMKKTLKKQESLVSCSTCDTYFSSSSERSMDCNDTAAASSPWWSSSGSPCHHSDAPLLVRSAVSQRHLAGSLYLSDEEVLGRIMVKSVNLPQVRDGYFVSNHIMINNERTKRTIAPLKRNRALDDIAREHASQMAKEQSLFHADLAVIEEKIVGTTTRLGANVGKGSSVKNIHKYMMTSSSVSDKNNIIDRRFVSMGVGTAKCGTDGTLYVCQLFSD